ncbi:MAG: hypothetical protein JWM11_6109 [Planctomycetaceae bacterium]|nr:hypothetical protein [Planctomycetaceae bacterium]
MLSVCVLSRLVDDFHARALKGTANESDAKDTFAQKRSRKSDNRRSIQLRQANDVNTSPLLILFRPASGRAEFCAQLASTFRRQGPVICSQRGPDLPGKSRRIISETCRKKVLRQVVKSPPVSNVPHCAPCLSCFVSK